MSGNVSVLGSLNVDVVFQCEEFPQPGETLLCNSVTRGAGGKGLNQAIASAKAGSPTTMYGALGCDSDAKFLLDYLHASGVVSGSITQIEGSSTGLAHIIVNRSGENSIVVSSGANMAPCLNSKMFATARADVFLAQLEMDTSLVHAFFLRAKECGATTILNAAPALGSARNLFTLCDIIIVNEHELAFFSDQNDIEMQEGQIIAGGRSLLTRNDQMILVTLGSNGVLQISLSDVRHYEAMKVVAIDTTGAGDCFCGVFAASIAKSQTVSEAIVRSTQAAAIAVTRRGAAASMPTSFEIERSRVDGS